LCWDGGEWATGATRDQRGAGGGKVRGNGPCCQNMIMRNIIAGGNNLMEFRDLTFQMLYTD